MASKICILGAGSWGTALALTACRAGQNVVLVPRRKSQAEILIHDRENRQYLPGVAFPENLEINHDICCLGHADVVLQVTPAQSLHQTCQRVSDILPPRAPWVICAKGIGRGSQGQAPELLSVISQNLLPNPVVILSGPSFANEVGENLPAAVTVASAHENAAKHVCENLRHSRFRCYISDDPIGVQIAGAVKNVLAIACGIIRGKKLGSNAAAALLTRGLAEMRRLGLALGAKSDTFFGLSGVGDVSLTCASEQSRNMRLGKMIGESLDSPQTIVTNAPFIAEGVPTVEAVYKLAVKFDLSMPVCQGVYSLLYDNVPLDQVIERILSRQSESEFYP